VRKYSLYLLGVSVSSAGLFVLAPSLWMLLVCVANVINFVFINMNRLYQVEYAIEAVKLGSTAVGIQTSQGVILAVEKRISSVLMEQSSVQKIMEIDSHIGCAVSGLIGGLLAHQEYVYVRDF
jgi:20S proteasome alpha/beta subunit